MEWIWIPAVLALIVFLIVLADTNRFVIREYSLQSLKIQKPYRFVMLSDLHDKSFGKENEKLLRAIDELAPEGIYIAGDMITAVPGKNFEHTACFIRKLAKRCPVYYGSGNHEYRMAVYPEKYGDMSERFERAVRHPGIVRLHNGKHELENDNILVCGLEIDKAFYKKIHAPVMTEKELENKLGKPEPDKFMILIAHNPAYFPIYAQFGADLVLSGHVHGGIARIPFLGGVISPALRLFPKYDGGIFKEGKSVMIVGRGLGSHTIPLRFLNPGELVVVTVTPKK